jgi:hypothetical protein
MLGRLGVLAAVLAVALVGGAVGRNATPAAAAAAALLCDGAQINTGGCVYLTQEVRRLWTENFDNRASSAWADFGPIALYSDIDFKGKCQTINPGVAVPLTGGWVGNNTVSSVRLGPCLASDWTVPQKLWPGNPSATGSGPFEVGFPSYPSYKYVGDVKVITGSSSGISCGSDWVKAEFYLGGAADLNRGAGGAFVYLCYRLSTVPTFHEFYAVAGDSSEVPCWHPSHYKVPGDLNKGAGGKFIYFCVADESSSSTRAGYMTRDIYFVRVGSTGTTLNQAWTTAQQSCDHDWLELGVTDLNAGAGGNYIFSCVERG